MIYVSILISFLILLGLIIAGTQNTTPVQITFWMWSIEMTLSAALLWAAAAGAAVVALLSLPKLSLKSLQARRLRKEVRRLEVICRGPL